MKFFWIVLFFLSFEVTVISQVRVRGYFKKNGTYVQPHVRTYPDGKLWNNYSYPGNYNPNSGKVQYGVEAPNSYKNNLIKTSPLAVFGFNDSNDNNLNIDSSKSIEEKFLQKFKKQYDKKNPPPN